MRTVSVADAARAPRGRHGGAPPGPAARVTKAPACGFGPASPRAGARRGPATVLER